MSQLQWVEQFTGEFSCHIRRPADGETVSAWLSPPGCKTRKDQSPEWRWSMAWTVNSGSKPWHSAFAYGAAPTREVVERAVAAAVEAAMKPSASQNEVMAAAAAAKGVGADPTERFRQILADISYRDWTFHVGRDGERCYLQVRFEELDPETGRVEPWGGRKWFLSPHMTRSEVVQTALKAVLTAEEHEARERFRYRGRAIFGPHYDVDRLWELAGDRDHQDVRKAA